MTTPKAAPTPVPVHVITDDAQAIAAATHLAAEFAKGASERDRDRRLP